MTVTLRRVVGVTTTIAVLVVAYVAMSIGPARATWSCPVSVYDWAVRDGDPQPGVRTISDGTVTVTASYVTGPGGSLTMTSWTADAPIDAVYVRGRGTMFEVGGGTSGGAFSAPDGSTISHVAWCYNTSDGTPPTTTEPPDDTTTTTFGTTTTTDGGTTTTTRPRPTTTTTVPDPTTTTTTAPDPTTTTVPQPAPTTSTTQPAPTTTVPSPTTTAPAPTTTIPPTTTTTQPATTTTTVAPTTSTTAAPPPDDGSGGDEAPGGDDGASPSVELGSTAPDAPTFETSGGDDGDDSQAPSQGAAPESSDEPPVGSEPVALPQPTTPAPPLLAVDWFSRMTTDQRVLVAVGFGLGSLLTAMGLVKGYRSRD